MAAKSKKRLSKNGNKLFKLDNLELKDVLCPICQSILDKPVTLPCLHGFCLSCFNGSVENNALCCPLCRLRIGSWLRTATKQKNLVNEELWKYIQTKFAEEINCRNKGEDIRLPEEKPILRLSAPGEIRREYEAELSRLRKERLQLEEKHLEETELLIKKIQEEEEEAHRKYLEALKRDEIIAQQMQNNLVKCSVPSNSSRRFSLRSTKPRFKNMKIDGYLAKIKPVVPPPTTAENSPIITDDNTTSTECSSPKPANNRLANGVSPEMVPTYSKYMKSINEKKNKILPGLWNKENGERQKDKKEDPKIISKKTSSTEENKSKVKLKNSIPSLLVSLPLPCSGILQPKPSLVDSLQRKGADSVDSMRQELCYFKPIDEVTTTSACKGLPVRVLGVRPTARAQPTLKPPPTRAQYLDGLCNLRHNSFKNKLPSAFVLALELLRVYKKESPSKSDNKSNSKLKKRKSTSPAVVPSVPARRNPNRNKLNKVNQIDSLAKLNNTSNLRRTRSMGSISKDENETTPKKAKKQRKVVSDKKPYLRSDSKKSAKKIESPLLYAEALNNNKVNLAVKNLSSPFKSCDVKHIYQEQLRIEKMIEQEKIDFDLARKIEEEWNGRRPRRAAVKRQVTLNYALRPAKKLKV